MMLESTGLQGLAEEHCAFIQHRVSINVASRNASNEPSVARALGCRVSQDGRAVTVFLSEQASGRVLDDLRENGCIAVVFSQPSTHRTIQLKGRDAHCVPIDDSDWDLLEVRRQGFVEDLVSLGYRPEFARAAIPDVSLGVTAVCFTPAEAYQQTPGPDAGRPL